MKKFFEDKFLRTKLFCTIYVTEVLDRACACLKSILSIGVDKGHRASNWVLILYQTCTIFEMNCKQELCFNDLLWS